MFHSRLGRKKETLFNDALNTFYLRLYGVRHMVKDHSDSERGNPLPPHGLLFPISSKGSVIWTIPQTGSHIPRPLLHQSLHSRLKNLPAMSAFLQKGSYLHHPAVFVAGYCVGLLGCILPLPLPVGFQRFLFPFSKTCK